MGVAETPSLEGGPSSRPTGPEGWRGETGAGPEVMRYAVPGPGPFIRQGCTPERF